MARLTLSVTAGQDAVSALAVEELAVAFEATLATLVADGASPTEAHVTAANDAYTALKAVWTKDLVVDYNRSTINTDNLKAQALRAVAAFMNRVR